MPETQADENDTRGSVLQPPELIAALRCEIDFVNASGVLGRAGRLKELFDLLAERSLDGLAVKEAEISVSVMRKGPSGSDDSAARVYVFRLRQRLSALYRQAPTRRRLSIPNGGYRLVLEDAPPISTQVEAAQTVPARPSPPARWRRPVAIVASLLILNVAAWAAYLAMRRDEASALSSSNVWAGLVADDGPLIVAVGDYYVFGEYENRVELRRLVRDFTVNSKEDLVATYLDSPEKYERYSDVSLRYLPSSASYALIDLAEVLDQRSDVRVKLASDITPTDLKHADIIYVGLINGLGPLRNRVFAASRYRVSADSNKITDQTSGQIFTSEALFAAPTDTMYRDYGLLSTFEGVTGNRIVVIAGAQNAALMGITEQLTHGDGLRALDKASGGAPDFEALFEVKGQKSIDLQTDLLGWARLDSQAVWTPSDAAKTP